MTPRPPSLVLLLISLPLAGQQLVLPGSIEVADVAGRSVALSGDTLVVCVPFEDGGTSGVNGDEQDDSAPESGAVFVFVRDGEGWVQQAYLKASNTGAGDQFGTVVAIDGDTIAVGTPFEGSASSGVNGDQGNDDLLFSGAVYVFVRDAGAWSQQAYLKASNTGAEDGFGLSVAVSGDTLAVGAPNEDSTAAGVGGSQGNGRANSGVAYVFAREAGAWSQQAYVKASNPTAGDNFGRVALSGDTLVVGAPQESSDATGVNSDQGNDDALGSGAAYVYVRQGKTWAQQAYLKASNTGEHDHFATALALEGDTLVVRASDEDGSASGVNGADDDALNGSGAAYLFRRVGVAWKQFGYLKSATPMVNGQLGLAVALSGDTVALGAPGEAHGVAASGAAYVYELPPPAGLAAVALRNGGANPLSYFAGGVVPGQTFTATVDNPLAGQLLSLLFAFEAPVSVTLGGGQTLLCLDLGSGELFTGSNLSPSSSAAFVDTYQVAVPDLPFLHGIAFSSQAIQFGHFPFTLSNAQDFTIGSF